MSDHWNPEPPRCPICTSILDLFPSSLKGGEEGFCATHGRQKAIYGTRRYIETVSTALDGYALGDPKRDALQRDGW